MGQLEPRIWEDGDRVYMVAPVSPLAPSSSEIEELAFAEEFRKTAPNENILWLQGQYVEADKPNLNNQMWSAGELAIKSLTPNFMPVTVMHDPRTAVGLIADTKLLVPDRHAVPRARIDSTLAVWAHRFPEVAEECAANYEQGTLMQSMEALSPYYSCADCGRVFHKLPDHAERANWCSHLKGDGRSELKGEEGSAAARILGNVTFTGTGLIFGTRGARGANSEAHLEIDQAEIAAFHEEAHQRASHQPSRPKPRSHQMEISQEKYDELMARPTQAAFDAEKARADEATSEKAELETKLEQAETAKATAEQKATDAETALDAAREESRKATLASERMGALGKGFKAKLGEFTSQRLAEQASTYSDEEWDSRLTELEEMASVKRDEGGSDEDEDGANGSGSREGEFSREEVASARIGGGDGNGNGSEPSAQERRTLVGSLIPAKKSE